MYCHVALLLFTITTTSAFRGLPSLPGYLNSYGAPSSSQGADRAGRAYSRVFNTPLEQLTDGKEKDPVLSQIRQNVESDIKKISDEVGMVSRRISAIYNNQSISVEDKNRAIQVLSDRYPKIVPAILNLIGKLHKINQYTVYDQI